MDTDTKNSEWSTSELEAAVDAYLKMMAMEEKGQKINKAYENRLLRAGVLAGRTVGSVEYRMLNISTVLERMGRGRIDGYKSLPHVGSNIESHIREALASRGVLPDDIYSPTSDDVLLERRAIALQKQKLKGVPKGILKPQRASGFSISYLRDPQVRAWVRNAANGYCEACGAPAPFEIFDLPFLEIHHVKPLADSGSDRVTNAIALCPNCHRRCHYSSDRKQFTTSLYKKVHRLVLE
ncbi:HNH endonuclease [Pseudomonas moraviensis]